MPFLHPMLLWFLPLVAVPIVLHLLTLRRLRTVELATFRFLFDSYVQQRRRMKFLEALLAALRTLFVLLLILLVSRPVVRHWSALFGSGAGRDVVMLIDASASMNAGTGGLTAMQRARSAALAVVGQLGSDDRLTVFGIGTEPKQILHRYCSDVAEIRDGIEAMKAGPAQADMLGGLRQLFAAQADAPANRVVYLFSDMQAAPWRAADPGAAASLVPPATRLVVVDVGAAEAPMNCGVIGDRPARRVIAGLPVMLRPRVVRFGGSGPAATTLTVFIEDKQIAQRSLQLAEGESLVRPIVYIPKVPGVVRGRFELTGDAFADDDSFLFTLNVVPQVNILLVHADAGGADPLVSEGLYLSAALKSIDDPNAVEVAEQGLAVEQQVVRSIDVRELAPGAINPPVLNDAGAVILANCSQLNAEQYGWLRQYVYNGGGLIILPGDRVDFNAYNSTFFPVPGRNDERVCAVQLEAPQGDPEDADTFERLAAIDFAHPLLSVFDDPESRYLKTAHFFRRFVLNLPEQAARTWPLARFADGGIALAESRYGQGMILLAAFPANAKWTDLTVKVEFVPLVLRMIAHVAHRGELSFPSVVAPGGVAEFVAAMNWQPVKGQVTDPGGRSSPLTFARSGSRLLAAFERTEDKGYYDVTLTGGVDKDSKSARLAFAVNVDSEESDFATVSEAKLRSALGEAQVSLVNATAEAQQVYGGLGRQREAWGELIVLVFIVIAVEFLLATLGGQHDPDEPTGPVTQRLRRLSPGRWVGRMTGAAEKVNA